MAWSGTRLSVKALTFQGVGGIRVDEVPDPVIAHERDAIVEVELAAICGSDLHVYHGRETGLDPGTVMGHECVGRVVTTGAGVEALKVGDRVACPFTTSCGGCFYCTSGLSARCTTGQLFGWVRNGMGLQGAQAQLVRVPLADTTLLKLPDDLPAAEALLLCDVLPTGYHCARMGEVSAERATVVIGCGPVGLMAIAAARELGAERLFVVDTIEERLVLGAGFGATAIDARREDARGVVRAATGGRGADAVLEAVGSLDAARLAFELVRPGGTIAVVGVHHEAGFPFSPPEAYDMNLTWRIGRCPARSLMDELVPLVRRRGRELARIFTHRLPLAEGVRAYEIFDGKLDGCIKVALVA